MNLGDKNNKLKVKVCGITTLKEVQELVKLPIDYLGFIFAKKSKRYITAIKAKKLIKFVKENSDIETVGVFLNPLNGEIEDILKEIQLDIVQIHGTGDSKHNRIWKAVNGRENSINFEELSKRYEGVLIDSGSGGTGVTFDWERYKEIGNEYNIILAGGLNKDNVKVACEIIKPKIVDVNSGVEDKITGKKDIEKVKEFLGGLGYGR